MPFDIPDIPDEIRRNPKPYIAFALLAVVVLAGGLAYRRTSRERDYASLAKAEAELKAKGLLLASEERDNAVALAARSARALSWRGAKPSDRRCTAIVSRGTSRSPFPAILRATWAAWQATHLTRELPWLQRLGHARRHGSSLRRSSSQWKVVREISDPGFPTAVAISADGTRVAHASLREVVVTNVADGKRLFACSERARSLAIHPSGFWVAVCGHPFLLIGMQGTPQLRKPLVGGKFVPSPEDRETLTDEGLTEDTYGDELPMGRESVESAGFSRDGKWFWCGTTGGLRVYDWNAVTHVGKRHAGARIQLHSARRSPHQGNALRLPECSKEPPCDRRRA